MIFVQPSFIGGLLQKSRKRSPNSNIKITSMPIIHRFDRSKIIRKLNDLIIVAWTKYLVIRFKIKDPVILFYDPRFAPVIGKINRSLIWYEVIDDRLGFLEVPRWLESNIDYILAHADLVTVTSSQLYQMTRPKSSGLVSEVGNGVDFSFFSTPQCFPKDLQEFIGRPIIGYIGSIGEWFDFGIVEEMATNFPSAVILIIGFVFPNVIHKVRKLEKFPNIQFLGVREYETLPNYLQAFTVCIIPFEINDMTRAVNPVKFYEYCSQGKPVVTSALPELQKYSKFIGYAIDRKEFLKQIELILGGTKVIDPEELKRIAKAHSWESKVEIITTLLCSLEKR